MTDQPTATATAHRPARFPLRPGRPTVFRRSNGAWGYTCTCLDHSRVQVLLSSERHNADSWAQALREALIHVEVSHLSAAERETAVLEALFALPAAGGVR